MQDLRTQKPVRWLTVTALLTAMNVAMSSFGVPVPGGHFYLNDIVIDTDLDFKQFVREMFCIPASHFRYSGH